MWFFHLYYFLFSSNFIFVSVLVLVIFCTLPTTYLSSFPRQHVKLLFKLFIYYLYFSFITAFFQLPRTGTVQFWSCREGFSINFILATHSTTPSSETVNIEILTEFVCRDTKPINRMLWKISNILITRKQEFHTHFLKLSDVEGTISSPTH